jgi:hypothetical protein
LELELLEDRLAPAVIDLTQPGASGTANGAIFSQFTPQPAGSGAFNSFVRLSTNAAVEQGYNTNFRPVQFDTNNSSSFTHALQLGSVPTVVASNGMAYYEFPLDINQSSTPPNNLLSLDELRLYVTDSSTTDPTLLHNYNPSTATLQDDAGRLYAPRYDLNPGADVNYVKLDANLSSGNGAGDMVALIPVTLLGTDASQYVYLYSEFGVHYANTGGYEQWAAQPVETVGSIRGVAFVDQKGSGVFAPGDPGLGGVTVYLDGNNNGMLDPGEVSTVTAADGTFSFTNLLPGTYHVREVVPNGYTQTAQINADVTLSAGQNATGVDFGNFRFAAVQGTTFTDITGNGFSSDDTPLSGLTIKLYKDANNDGILEVGTDTLIASTTTASNGTYSFSGLAPGTYFVQQTLPPGYFQTGGPSYYTITPTSGGVATGNNFDDFQRAGLSGTVFQDLTGNGLSPDDPPLSAVPVTIDLYQGTTLVGQTTTNNNGTYSFANLGPGPYTVTEVVPNGWYLTAGPSGPITVQSGATTSNVNFDNFLVAELINNNATLDVFTTSAVGGTVSVAQPILNTTTVTFDGVLVGTFSTPSQNIQINSNANFTVATTQVTATPVLIYDQPGNDTYQAGASGTTIFLDAGGTDTISVAGGNNTLDFSRTTFGVTFNAGLNQGQPQQLDTSGLNFVSVTGVFQTIIGTPFNDTFTAALPTFNPATGVITPGTTILSGLGQDTIIGTLGTSAREDGSGSQYVEMLNTGAAAELNQAISVLGGSTSDLAGFQANVAVNGGSSTVDTSLLTNVALGGTQNTVTQALDSNAASVLQTALSSFGNSVSSLAGFGGSLSAAGGFNTINTSVLTNTSIAAGTNTYNQFLDPNAVTLLDNTITGFGRSVSNLGGFGNAVSNLGGFGGSLSVAGGFNTITASMLTNVNVSSGKNTFDQTIDTNAENVLNQALSTIQTSFGGSLAAQGGFGAALNSLGGFGNSIASRGGFNTIYSSILTAVSFNGGTNNYVQAIDANSTTVLENAIASFGNSLTIPGGFGNSVSNVGGFGNSVKSSGGFNQVLTSLLTSVSLTGGNNTYVQGLDANAAKVLDTALTTIQQAFGASQTSPGGFGSSVKNLGGFGNSITTAGGFNQVASSLLTTVTLGGTNNTYIQRLDANSAAVLNQALTSYGASVGNAGGFGDTLTSLGGFGNSLTTSGGFNQVETSLLTTVTLNGTNNLYVQTLDANSAAVLNQALSSFGSSLKSSGGFGNSLATSGGFGNSVTLPGGFSTVYTSLLTSVSAGGGNNVLNQALDANSVSVLNNALTAVGSVGTSVANLAGFGNSLKASGGFNNGQAGILTTVSLSGGMDNVVEKLDVNAITVASTAITAAATAGQAAANTVAASIGLQASLGDGDDVVVGGLLGTFTVGTGNDRIVIEDPSLLGAASVPAALLPYGGTFTAGAGSNTFYVVGKSNFGVVTINEPATNNDTLDLSSIQVGGPTLDLSTSAQQQVLPGQLALTLSAPAGFQTVIGNGNATSLKAGSRAVTLEGAAPLDDRVVNPPAPQGQTQVVYLDFVDFNPAGDHIYTSDEQTAILQRLQQDYQPFDFSFKLQKPTSGLYTTIFFNKTPASGEAGGDSSEIDWRNLNLADTADVDVNGLLGGSGEPPATTGPTGNFVALTAEIAAHELGHTVGLRHQDSFGPIGFGVHNPPGVDAFRPAYTVAQAAWETAQHIIASPASVGSSLFDAVAGTYFGERELIKLAFIEDGTVVNEQTNSNGSNANVSMATAQPLALAALAVPNTEPRGFDAGKVCSVAAIDVANASIQLDPNTGQSQSDYYSFSGRAGDLINIETLSNSLARISEPVDTVLNLYDDSGNLVATNDDDFETADSLITDFKLPADRTGTYYVQVTTFKNTEVGHYELFLYRFQAGNATPSGGSNDTFAAGPGATTIIGRGGNDTVEDSGATTYTLTDGLLTGTGTTTLQNVRSAVLTGSPNGSTFNVSGWTGSATLIGVGGTNTVVVNRDTNFTLSGNTLTLANGGTFTLVNIQNVLLTGGPSGSTFDVGGWTGSATLTGVGGTNTIVASRSANFVLTDTSLSISGGGNFTLVNVHNAILTGGLSGSIFDVRGWTGTTTLNSLGGSNPVVTPRGSLVTTAEGPASMVVAGFTDAGPTVAANYTGTVDWGDSSSSPAVFSASGAVVTVTGTHSYAEEGSYLVTTTFHQGTAFSVIVSSPAVVADAQLTNVQVPTLNATEGSSTGTVVATFTDPGGSEPVSDYTAVISWGDGSGTAPGTVVDNGNGQLRVTANHLYPEEGTYTLSVTLTHDHLPPVIATGTVRVADAPLMATATAPSFVAQQGIALTNTRVATFVDGNSAGNVSDFTATISWGDGGSSAGSITQPGGPGTAFAVAASHTYAISGTDTVTVTINDVGGQTAATSFILTVSPSIFVLDPAASGALSLTGTVALHVGGAVVVDSNSPTAVSASGNAQITASRILVTGGVSATNGAVLSPAPTTGVLPTPDPLAGLPIPASGLPFMGSVNLSSGSKTIQPGIYTQITASGKGTLLTLNPGIYVLKGGGLSVSNSASINGSGVLIYNAGSNFPNPGGTFGAVSLTGSGTFSLTAPISGLYTGVLLFQARDNTQPLSLTANATVGLHGTLYAPAAQLVLNGGGQLATAAIVDQLRFTGNSGSPLTAAGFPTPMDESAGHLLAQNLTVYVQDATGAFTASEQARIHDAIRQLDTVVVPHGVTITEVNTLAAANVVIEPAATSPSGGQAQGVLGCFTSSTTPEEITIITGWRWYDGDNPRLIGPSQYDFETVVTHELGHALGLGHSDNPASVMYESLAPGVARRTITAGDLNLADATSPVALPAVQTQTDEPATARAGATARVADAPGQIPERTAGSATGLGIPSTILLGLTLNPPSLASTSGSVNDAGAGLAEGPGNGGSLTSRTGATAIEPDNGDRFGAALVGAGVVARPRSRWLQALDAVFADLARRSGGDTTL